MFQNLIIDNIGIIVAIIVMIGVWVVIAENVKW